jgi:predicted enzyme related to lactoylglutathione lyase
MHGQFAWYDLFTPDAAAAEKFYPAVIGWATQQWDKADYTMWAAGDTPIGGITPVSAEQSAQGVPPHWLAYVNVDNVEASANRVKALGGQVMAGPEDIPDVGRFAIIRDPQGAVLAIFKANRPMGGFDGTPAIGKFTWHELMTTDFRAALDFYRHVFGWEKTGEFDMGAAGVYVTYGMKGKSFGGIYNRENERAQVPPNWLFYANVTDVDKAAAAAQRAGGTIVVGPMDVPGGDRVAVGIDAQGAHFAVHQTKARSSAPAAKAQAKKKPKTKPKAKAAAKKPKPQAKGRVKARPKKAARKTKRR